MPAFAAITLADGQTTPANHTFSPVALSNNLAELSDASATTVVGRPVPSISTKRVKANQPDAVNRTVFKIVVPVVDSTSNPLLPTAVALPFATIEFGNISSVPDSVLKDLVAYSKNLLANAIVSSLVVGRETIY